MIGRMRWLENARWLVVLGDAPAGLAAILKVLYLVLADLFHPWPRSCTLMCVQSYERCCYSASVGHAEVASKWRGRSV